MVSTVFLAGAVLTLLILMGMQLSAAATRRRERTADLVAAAEQETDRVRAEVTAREEAVRTRLMARIRQFGLRAALEGRLLLPPWADRRAALLAREAEVDQLHERQEAKVAEAEQEVSEAPIRSRSLAAVTAVIWLVSVIVLFMLDRQLLRSIGFGNSMSLVLATIVMSLIEVLGLMAFAALGVHHIDFIDRASAKVRVAVGCVAATVLAAIIVGGLIPLSHARADEAVGDRLRSAQSVLTALKSDPGSDAAAVAAQGLSVDKLQGEYDLGVTFGSLFTSGTAVATFALSWAPLAALAHLRLRQAKRGLVHAGNAQLAVQNERAAFDAEFIASVAEDLDLEGGNPADAAVLLQELPAELPAARLLPPVPQQEFDITPPQAEPSEPQGWAPPSTPPPPDTPTTNLPAVGNDQPPTFPPPDPFNLFPRSEQ